MLYSSTTELPLAIVWLMSCANAYSKQQSDNIKRWCLWKNYIKSYMKNFCYWSLLSCYNNVCLFSVCSYRLTPIFCSVGCFLYMTLFLVFNLETSTTFFYSNYMVEILPRYSKWWFLCGWIKWKDLLEKQGLSKVTFVLDVITM